MHATVAGLSLSCLLAAACGSVSEDRPIDATPGSDPDGAGAADASRLDAGWSNNALWEVADGLPDQGCAPWNLRDGAEPEDPVVVGDKMTITTNVNDESLYYRHEADDIERPADTFVLEARVRFVAGASDVDYRSGLGIGFVLGEVSNVLQFEDGTIFLLESDSVRGPEYDAPTADDYHDYKLELDIENDEITVSRDGVAVFTGTAYATPAEADLIYFGDATGASRATTDWQRVSHNAHVIGPCP